LSLFNPYPAPPRHAPPPSHPQEAFEAAIDVARRRTVEEVQRWGGDAGGSGGGAADDTQAGSDVGTPPRAGSERKQRAGGRTPREEGDGMFTPRGAGAGGTPGSAARGSAGGGAGAQVEARILAKVVAVVSPAPAHSTRLLARRAVTSRPDAAAHGLGEASPGGGGAADGSPQAQHPQQPHAAVAAAAPAAARKSMGIAGSRPAVVGAPQTSGRRGNVFRS
jgi:hypothetical protein